jgi:hypothetical protein
MLEASSLKGSSNPSSNPRAPSHLLRDPDPPSLCLSLPDTPTIPLTHLCSLSFPFPMSRSSGSSSPNFPHHPQSGPWLRTPGPEP